MTPVSFAAHQSRLLISQGPDEIWVSPLELAGLVESAASVLKGSDTSLSVSRGGDELFIPRDSLPMFILEAVKAMNEPRRDH